MANNNETQSKTYKQQAGEYYNRQYDSWMPWIEDKYLAWFTKDNKASYATKRMSLLSFLRPHYPSFSLSILPIPPNQPPTHSPTRQKTSTRPKSRATSKSTQPKMASTAS
jgi:hypothetical protein